MTSHNDNLSEKPEEFFPEEVADTAATKPRRRGRKALAIVAALALLGGGAAWGIDSMHKEVSLDVNGEIIEAGTFRGDVGELLDELAIDVADRDLVQPAADEALTDGMAITVRTAREIEIAVDDETTTVWTHGLTAAEALEQLGARGMNATMIASRSAERTAIDLPLVEDGEVNFAVDGEDYARYFNGAVDLDGALYLAEIELTELDTVEVQYLDEAPTVIVTRIEFRDGESTKPVEFETVYKNTTALYKGESRVAQAGEEGVETTYFTEKLVNGEVEEKEVNEVKVTTDPIDKIVEIGTKAKPVPVAPKPAATNSGGSSSSGSSASSGGAAPTSGVWAKLAQCESGGNPSIVSSNGLYHGLYQFSVSTWKSVGGSGLPSQASPAEQTKRAQMLQARSGWGQWPACSSRLGLR